jgi:Rrf2 family cysteine metabolism transcriptional repressor
MLRVSSRGRYGVKAVFELASRYGQGPVSLTQIARAQGISEPYLEQLMPALKRSGLVAAVRGAQGGYELGRPPREITVGDVVRALEGPIALATCTGDVPQDCPEADRCIGPDVWARIQDALVLAMDAMTFEELAKAPRRRWARPGLVGQRGGSA